MTVQEAQDNRDVLYHCSLVDAIKKAELVYIPTKDLENFLALTKQYEDPAVIEWKRQHQQPNSERLAEQCLHFGATREEVEAWSNEKRQEYIAQREEQRR